METQSGQHNPQGGQQDESYRSLFDLLPLTPAGISDWIKQCNEKFNNSVNNRPMTMTYIDRYWDMVVKELMMVWMSYLDDDLRRQEKQLSRVKKELFHMKERIFLLLLLQLLLLLLLTSSYAYS